MIKFRKETNEKEMKIFPCACVRPFLIWPCSVSSHRVLLKIIVSFARVAALVAFVGFFSSVFELVFYEVIIPNGRIVTLITLVGFFSSMPVHVFLKLTSAS